MNQFTGNEMFPIYMFLSVGAIALFSFIAVAVWSDARRKEREAYYRSETLKKIAEAQGVGASSALDFLREEKKNAVQRRREGIKLGGLITVAAGIGIMAYGAPQGHRDPDYLIGLVPLFVGVSLLAYAYLFAPKE